jgi:hypothetical protein
VIVCSECKSPDKELLCWWTRGHFHTMPFLDDPQMARELGVYTVCGSWNCAMKVFQKYLENLKVTA